MCNYFMFPAFINFFGEYNVATTKKCNNVCINVILDYPLIISPPLFDITDPWILSEVGYSLPVNICVFDCFHA